MAHDKVPDMTSGVHLFKTARISMDNPVASAYLRSRRLNTEDPVEGLRRVRWDVPAVLSSRLSRMGNLFVDVG